MAETAYNRKVSTREDPRLARQKNSASNKNLTLYDGLDPGLQHKAQEAAIIKNTNNWQGQQDTYTQSMQSAYQHLLPSMYTDVRI